jgi:anti-anti-sigma regulatory factor
MLKITTVTLSDQEIMLQLDGRVAGQWIQLLRESAESALEEGLRLMLDFENISFVDCDGLVLIKSLIGRGVRQMNAPLFVAEQLRKWEAAQSD